MHLDRQLGGPSERAVGLERGNHFAWRPEMDVEGSEYAVLDSSADAIAKCDFVLMEWHDDPRGRRNDEWLIARFRQLQFDVDRPRANLIIAAHHRLHGSATAP